MKIRKFIEQNKSLLIKGIIALLVVIIIAFFSIDRNAVEDKGGERSKRHLLCIGVDKFETMGEREKVYNSIGQADGILLITIDETEDSVDIVAVPRDTMVTIEKYYSNMEYIGEEHAQICLQYAYADGLERSCELLVDRVEELFEGIHIDGYVAVNMTSVVEINDAIGGVLVEVHDEDTAQKMGVEVGSSVHLTHSNIALYLQSRDKSESQSAYGRMDRLKDYVKVFIPQAINVVKENPSIVSKLVKILGEHILTDLSVNDIVEITKDVTAFSIENIHYRILEGEIIMGEDGYEEFYPDRFKLEQIIREIK